LANTITSPQVKPSKAPAIIVAAICIIFALWSALWFWSAVLTVRPEAVITQWQQSADQNKEAIEPVLALKMIARLKQSIAINPLDANSHLLMAKYYQMLASTHPETSPSTNANVNTNQYTALAEQAYKKAIKHQPSWDYAWSELANFYSNQQPLNETKLITALSNAMILGPYESKSQQILIPLIFKHWPLITNNKQSKSQAQATKIIKHALKYSNALLTLNSAKKNQQLTTLAPLLTKQWHKNFAKKYLKEAANDK